MNIELWLSTISLVIALVALLIAWDSARKLHNNVIRVLHIDGGSCKSGYENNAQIYHHFAVDLRNLGMTLVEPNVSLRFLDLDGKGTVDMALTRYNVGNSNQTDAAAQFTKGMIGRFGFKSYELATLRGDEMLINLHDCRKQNAVLVLSTQGYDVRIWKIGRAIERVKQRYNGIAFRVNRWFDKYDVTPDGTQLLTPGHILPQFQSPERKLMYLVETLRRDHQRKTGTGANDP